MMKQTKQLSKLLLMLVFLPLAVKAQEGIKDTLTTSAADTIIILPEVQHPAALSQRQEIKDTIPLPNWKHTIASFPDDSIYNPGVLKSFFAGLDSLCLKKDTVLTIVHLGDSHIQAGNYSGQMMRMLQRTFGNAGRGWIAPFKLSRSNEPDDYFIRSTVKSWVGGRIIQHNKKTNIGPGGIGINTTYSSIDMNIHIAPKNGAGYSFNKVYFYRRNNSMPMLPTGKMKKEVTTRLGTATMAPNVVVDTFTITRQTDTLELHSTRRMQGTDKLLPASSFKNTYYGCSLLNGKGGILYHSIGVNGAMFIHYTDDEYMERLSLLKPSLLIVSLGTNETFGRRFREEDMERQIRNFIVTVRKFMPETAILLTTPPECYKRVYVNKKRTYQRNDNTEKAARVICKVSRDENVACWNLFNVSGGKNSSSTWFKSKMMGRDRIHFSKEGYTEQGILFYRALMQTYNHRKE